MRPGHEDCAHETIEIGTLAATGPQTIPQCLHDHTVPLTTTDGVETWRVADFCECCATRIDIPEWVNVTGVSPLQNVPHPTAP